MTCIGKTKCTTRKGLLRNEIAKFVANFGNFKRTSETVCQKFCETHCNQFKAQFFWYIGSKIFLAMNFYFRKWWSPCHERKGEKVNIIDR